MRIRSFLVSGLLALGLLAVSATPASAVAIVGQFDFAGLIAVKVTAGNIDWQPDANPPPNATPTYGQFVVNPFTAEGVFIGLGPEQDNLLRDMSNPAVFADANNVPVGASGGITEFIQIADRPTWEFVETFLVPGDIILGQPSPFRISQNGNNVDVSISLNGYAYDSLTPDLVTIWTAILTAQYTNTTVANVINAAIAGTLEPRQWSGTFEASPIPEPMTMLTFGAGSALLALRRRQRRK